MRTYFLAMLFLSGVIFSSCGNQAQNDTGLISSAPADASAQVDDQANASQQLKAILDSNVTRMGRMPLTNHPTKDFALILRVHHDGAEKLIQEVKKHDIDSSLARIAEQLEKDLRKETVVLNRFIIDNRFQKQTKESPVSNDLIKTMTPNSEPSTPLSGDVSEDFAKLMITNLQSANDMVDVMKDAGADYDVSGFTEEMVARNEKYIEALKEWTTKG